MRPEKKRMQYCYWCGQELGIYERHSDDFDTCGKIECNRQLKNSHEAEEDELKHEAEQDHYDRYR